jgi:tRNA A-37 threonylcarbamoyl transferase component Bud32
MNDEHLIAGLSHALSKSKRSQFNAVTSDEKRELASLARKMPPDLEILKDGSRSQVGGYQLASGREVVLKYYYPKNFVKKLRNRFVTTRCRRSWIAAHGFAHLTIPTPDALAIAEHHHLGFLNSMSLLATDRAFGTQLRHLPQNRMTNVVPALRSAFGVMEEFHIAHGDLKANNIIVSDEDEISFIDLDATRFYLHGSAWQKARTYDRTRFLRNWKEDPKASEIFQSCFD